MADTLLVPKSEPFSEGFELEDVEVVGEEGTNIDSSSASDSDGDRAAQHDVAPNLESTVKKLVSKVRALEQQVAACLESQPLLYQLFGKCNRLEQRLKEMRKGGDGRQTGKVTSGYNKQHSFRLRTPQPSGKSLIPNVNNDMEVDDLLEDDANDREWQPSGASTHLRNNSWQENTGDNEETVPRPLPRQLQEIDSGANPLPPRPRTDTEDNTTEQLNCRYCHKLITRKARLREHEFYHRVGTFENPGSCSCKEEGCDFVGAERSEVLDHYRALHPNSAILKPFKCKLCAASSPGTAVGFYDEEALARHYTKFHPAGATSSRHRNFRESVTRRTCPVCSKVFGRAWEMKQHMRMKHSNKPPPRVACDLCGKSYLNRRVAKTHQLQVHGRMSEAVAGLFKFHEDGADTQPDPDAEIISCTECGVEMLEKSLPRHMLTHGSPKPRFSCETCGQTFFHPSRLQRHQVVHGVERPFVCSHEGCGKSFPRKPSLAEHELLHTGKPHLCDECGWAGATPRDLRRHKEKHANGTLRAGKPKRGRPSARVPRQRKKKSGAEEEARAIVTGPAEKLTATNQD